MKINETLELLIDLVEGLVQEEGFKTLKMSRSNIVGTTAYDGLVLRDANGQEYTITFDKSVTRDHDKFNWHSTDYIKDASGEVERGE